VGLTVAKVGGSLFDLPDLRERLRAWVRTAGPSVLLVPGGGTGADVIRHLDHVHRLGEERAHWLALRVLTVNAQLLADLMDAPVLPGPAISSPLAVLDPHAFCRADDARSGALRHSWAVTSDAIAARVAEVAGARLVLLKSFDRPAGMTWEDAGAAGLVDEAFPALIRRASLTVDWVNLRSPGFLPR
jgi:5-(aminomethyl)-3-furanmethanol phosphate kinase